MGKAATSADSAAEEFAADVTRLLQTASPPDDFKELRNLFRLAEVFSLMKYCGVRPEMIGYLLHIYKPRSY